MKGSDSWAIHAPRRDNLFGHIFRYEKVDVLNYKEDGLPWTRRVVIPLDNTNYVVLEDSSSSSNFTLTFGRGSYKKAATYWDGYVEDPSMSWRECDRMLRKLRVFLKQSPAVMKMLTDISSSVMCREPLN